MEGLEETNPLSEFQLKKRCDLQVELLKILEDEELYWFKRSHETWLLKGDNNTEFFNRVANGKKRNKTIFSLSDGDNLIKGNENLLKYAIEYYKSLFGPGDGDAFQIDSDLWSPDCCVSPQENLDLTRPFEEEEVKFALFQMEKNKVAGPDGNPV